MNESYPGDGIPQPPADPPPRKRHPIRKWLIIATATFAGFIVALVVVLAGGVGVRTVAGPPRALVGRVRPGR